jgi:hypothetical protein
MSDTTVTHPAFTALRAFAKRGAATEHCELCRTPIATVHDHLLARDNGALQCACRPCALLFATQGARWQLVPPRAEAIQLVEQRLVWGAIAPPIDLAFCVPQANGEIISHLPGPAGATTTPFDKDSWTALVAANPRLATIAPETQALLVCRLAEVEGAFLVSIDRCYELVGTIRRHWRGLGGGPLVRAEIARFLATLVPEHAEAAHA